MSEESIVLVEFSNKEQLEAAGMILIKCCFDITFRLLDKSIEIHHHSKKDLNMFLSLLTHLMPKVTS